MNIKLEFPDKLITPLAVFLLLKNKLDKIGLRKGINDYFYLHERNSNSVYYWYEIIECFIVNVLWADATRFIHTEIGRFDYP